jgi:hypothetical protein
MTVKQLIKALEKMPQDAVVMYYDGDNGWTTPSNIQYGKFPRSIYHKGSYVEGVNITGD